MPAVVPAVPQPSELAAHLVGEPVSATSCGRVWASQINYLLGHAVQHVCSVRLHAITPTTTACDIPIQWRPSPGCRMALLRVDLQYTASANLTGRVVSGRRRSTLALTLPAGASRIDNVGSAIMDGAAALVQQDVLRVGRNGAYYALISLGAAGSVADQIRDLTITVAGYSTDQHTGVAVVTLTEIPVATLRPEVGEVGALTQAIDPRSDMHDGDSSIGTGVPELLTGEQDAAIKVREHFQLATYEDTTLAWSVASAVMGAINWVGTVGTTYSPQFRLRVRAIHGLSSGTPAAFTLRVRYYSTDAGTLRVVKRPRGAGVSANHDVALPSSGGAWTALADTTLTLRADGTDQEMDLEFQALVDSGTLYISSIAIIQTETA